MTDLAAKASSYWEDARRLEQMPEFESSGLTGPQWAVVYRAVAEELRKCGLAEAWDRGYAAAYEDERESMPSHTKNPYRKDEATT